MSLCSFYNLATRRLYITYVDHTVCHLCSACGDTAPTLPEQEEETVVYHGSVVKVSIWKQQSSFPRTLN